MPKKILLADDSITIQKVVELTFSDGDYEVSAVNNGAKAIQKLSEMRPDIILSDIIMPEKNGYEVCEYVKSHPDYRNIPVVLLTGTFEPFDPDRAEKAGCDAVVTKPFESQSLIHKVEELISQARSAINATAVVPIASMMPAASTPPPPPPAPEFAPSPWMEDTTPVPPPVEASPFTTSGGSFPLPPLDSFTHNPDIFGAASAPESTTEMPFDTPAESPFGASSPAEEFSGETRAFPRMSFEELQQMAPPSAPEPEPEPEPVIEPSPWDEPPVPSAMPTTMPSPFASEPEYSAETRAFTKMSFEEIQQMSSAPAPVPEPQSEPDSPFGAPPPAEEFSGETRAFPRLNFEEMQQMVTPVAAPSAPEPEPLVETSPWDEAPTPQTQPEPSPWGEPAAFGGETRAFPKMSFEDLQQQMSTPAPEPEPEPEPPTMAWDQPESDAGLPDYSSHSGGLADFTAEPAEPAASALPEDLPFAEPEPQAEESMWAPTLDTASSAPPEMEFAEAASVPSAPEVAPVAVASETGTHGTPQAASPASSHGELTDDQVDRIARRVIELMSDSVVRNIAWEVIPDLAEMVVKERIRQLESEG
jgi:CheY-like chemotaxis protein